MLLNCVLEKTLESPLDCKDIQPVHPKGDQSWVFIGRTVVDAEAPVLWPPNAKSWLIWKDPDAGEDWGQEEKGTTEDEMAGWHHRLIRHGFGWTPGVGDGQGGLVCCGSWSHKESHMTATELNLCHVKYDLFWTRILGPCEIIILIEWLFENLEAHLELEKVLNSTSSTVQLFCQEFYSPERAYFTPRIAAKLPIVYCHNTVCFLSNTWHNLILYLISYLICIFSKHCMKGGLCLSQIIA